MSLFEFLMMIAAVAVAIGITEIVGGWGRILRSDTEVKVDWPHLGWTIVIMLTLIQYWIGMWSYSKIEFTQMAQIFFLVLPTLFCVLAAFAITPTVPVQGKLDGRAYYLEKRAVVFIPFAVFLAMATAADLIIAGPHATDSVLPNLILLVVFAAMVITPRVWVHGLMLLLSLLQFVLFMVADISILDTR